MENLSEIDSLTKDTQIEQIQLNEETIHLPTIQITSLKLFHGSNSADIASFDLDKSDQMTIGRGVYFALTDKTASEYANWRSDENSNPTVYEAEIKNAKIADLRTREAQEQFAKLHKQALLEWEKNILPNIKSSSEELTQIIKRQRKKMITDTIKKIDENSWKQLRDITFNWADLVSTTLSAHGYKGLLAIEGEPPAVDFHDSIVIFDPQNTLITDKKQLNRT